jgi:hemin uptake protein HemP
VTEESQNPHVSFGVARTTEQPASGIREVRFEQISGGQTELIVEHAGQKYRLIATKNGRLVLNK